jgi:hypothetical protein
MTDSRNQPEQGRVDLRALEPSDAQADRVIGAVMGALPPRLQGASPSRPDALEIVGRYLPPRWIVAAALLLIASSVAVVARPGPAESTSIDSTVAMWASQEHVPTNAELLSTFQGYQR